MNIFFRLLDKLEYIGAFLAKVLLVILTLIVILNVIIRSMGEPVIWATEISEYILIYITFLGAAYLLKHDGHVTVDLFDLILPEKIKVVLNFIVYTIGLIISALLFYYGTVVTVDAWEKNLLSLTVLQIPLAYIYVIIPIGSFMLVLEFIRKLIKIIQPK